MIRTAVDDATRLMEQIQSEEHLCRDPSDEKLWQAIPLIEPLDLTNARAQHLEDNADVGSVRANMFKTILHQGHMAAAWVCWCRFLYAAQKGYFVKALARAARVMGQDLQCNVTSISVSREWGLQGF